MEKPMARTLAEGEALVRLANETGRRLYVLEQAVYPSYLDTVEEVIRSGEIGEVLMYDMISHQIFDATPEHSAGGYGTTPWRIHADFPLGTLFDGGHHPLARLSRLFGPPASVYASGRQIRPTYGEFDHVLMHFEYEGGVRGSFSYSTVFGRQKNHFYVWGSQGGLAIERSRIVIDHYDGGQRTVEFPSERGYESMWRALLAAITERRDPYYTKERAFQDLSILFAVWRSTQAGAKVRV
jgi:predicted dehydrogenase